MDAYQTLMELVQSKISNLSFVFSIPRTRSTALQIALTQADEIDGQLNEPMHNYDFLGLHYNLSDDTKKIRSFNECCKRIIERINELLESTQKNSIGLIIHEHLLHILKDEMELLLNLTKNVVIIIRDPILQVLSFLTRTANDKLIARREGRLPSSQILKILKNIETTPIENLINILENSISKKQVLSTLNKNQADALTSNDILKVYQMVLDEVKCEITIAWDNLNCHMQTLLKHTDKINLIIVDSEVLLSHAERAMIDITKALSNISFNKSMINNWQKGVGQDFRCCITASWGDISSNNGWNGPARNSRGFTGNHDAVDIKPSINEFPEYLWDILNKALKDYKEYLAMPELKIITTEKYYPKFGGYARSENA